MIMEYWISPKGIVIDIEKHPVITIVRDPLFFGYTIDEMQIIYAKYSDTNEMEGEATKTIISDLIEKGWIYCHRRNTDGDWLADVNKLDKTTRFNLQLWTQFLRKEKLITDDQNLRIYRRLRDLKTKRTFEQILEGNFFD
ncbi:MAG: hypothetical protein K0B81_07865 [Candidatus Cloacimonetes bacterium]|nr:hypothetical protein [Candidatus Cloacimonadota bacterium]